MAEPTGFKIKGLKRWKMALDAGNFDAELKKSIGVATALNGKIAEALLRKTIQGSGMQKNAALTIAIKKSAKPGVDSGLMFQSITSNVVDAYTVFVGVLRTSRNYNVVDIMINGREIKVTAKMRGMFYLLFRATRSKARASRLTGRAAELFKRMQTGWLPLKRDTKVIIIPARNYFQIAFANTQMIKKARDNWRQAIAKTLRDIAEKDKGD